MKISVSILLLAAVSLTADAATKVKGSVTTESGEPVESVAVSDGHSVVLTDVNGRYTIDAATEPGYVFISSPDGYEPAERLGNRPKFWAYVSAETVGDINFKLRRLPADSAMAVIAVADLQISNRCGDCERLRELYVPDLNRTIDSLRHCGLSPVVITLGDQICDWFVANGYGYTLDRFNADFTVNAPVYHTMGNHDNDPFISGDLESAATWHSHNGPSYYSFNRGGAHFIVTDNMLYSNPGAQPGKSGKRSYSTGLTADQLAWIENDLATVKDKNAPLFITMHGPLLSYGYLDGQTPSKIYRFENGGPELGALFKDFSNVKVLSGHAHKAHYQHTPDHRIREYNYASACGTWWPAKVTPYHSNFWLGCDGSPWGYGIWDFSAAEPRHLYKGFAMSPDYQIRAYDLNCVAITDTTLTKDYLPGDPANRNAILANVWAYEPGGSVKMYENGRELKVTRVKAQDPLHFMLRAIPLKAEGVEPVKALLPEATTHIFRATASAPDTEITVEYTDPYGQRFTTTLHRPAPLAARE